MKLLLQTLLELARAFAADTESAPHLLEGHGLVSRQPLAQDDALALAQRIADLGQPLYGKAEPTGYSNTGEGWANTAGLLARINFAAALVEGRVPGVSVATARFDGKKPAVVAGELLSMPPSKQVEIAIESGLQSQQLTSATIASLVIASPDFQRR
jgi:uncharacterized protein (DUF1800 family)